MRRLLLALFAVLSLAFASPVAAQPLQDYKTGGEIPPCKFSDRQLAGALDDLPPDIEQYAPDYAEQLRNARGAPCGGKGTPASGATTIGANERVEDVPAPPSTGGARSARVPKPPVPVPAQRVRLADVSSPAITARPTGPDVPTWVLVLLLAALVVGSALTAAFLIGADLPRLTRSVGAAAGEARARAADRAIKLWETVRLGR